MPILSPTDFHWILETQQSAYCFHLHETGLLVHDYFGPRLPHPTDYPRTPALTAWSSFNDVAHQLALEYPGYAGLNYTEPCLKATFSDGVRDLRLRFVAAHTRPGTAPELTLELRDEVYPLRVQLHYRLHAEQDLIERWVSLENMGGDSILLERVWSAQLHLPEGQRYHASHLTGRWFDEFHLQHELLPHGSTSFESRRLQTSHAHNPWIALDDGSASEESGSVWFGALAWSGTWKIAAELNEFERTRISLGINDWDFAWRLESGQTFSTPPALLGYTAQGFGAASRSLHDYIREEVLPHGDAVHPVLYNSWEATQFDVNETSQIALARLAAEMGVELFVVDDGWFHRRDSDRAGLGDWRPDERKFPHGLGGLIEAVQSLGMRFGLWVEPEMVSPDSDLYRAHPDWVIHFPTRARTESRNQLILNLARSDVQEYLIAQLDQLLSQYPITFIKWDMNRSISEPGWPDAPGDPRELWVRYTQGVYRVWGELRQRHPDVIWQSCSGGGARADLGILRLADQIWVSDNTEATARLHIQHGFSQVFPANVMEAWVTDMGAPRVPLIFRFHASMCGALGVGGNLLHWSPEERALARECIAQYQQIRPIVQLGDQYRLHPPRDGFCALEYISKDRHAGVLFAFRTQRPEPTQLPRLYPRGLEAQACYRMDGYDQPRTGAAWMQTGLSITLKDMESCMLRFWQVETAA